MGLENICKYCHQDIHAVIVGNKCDLTAERDITPQEGEQIAESLQMPFFETNAKELCNVNLALLKLTNLSWIWYHSLHHPHHPFF